ncbi:effector of murein hydrolase LrgB [Thermosulfidibacter takaii ABI70S6]|uniref:Effector of murein hydrolase LrgB n=1 Tax=Thermosulfidibacter takaii (strain DSM 17441 / JCM 13301 / NBRC 103674 / ABI70S6) TaxID=1298851 RepID=A0A0S3QUE7_THET7|nr:effector of murein hydrolase LrgB [Thermosulfidibacter takaii ABI70S6]
MKSAGFIFYLLGPAVVSLAIPLYKEGKTILEYAKEIAIGVIFGGILAAVTAVHIAKLLGASRPVLLNLAPKSVTTAIAIGISEKIGGIPALTAVWVIITGILGNAVGVEVLNLFEVKDRVARGLGMGVTSHGLGTARIILDDELSGAVSGLAMALNGVFTSFMLPYLVVILLGR